ncbi:YoaK family protein [Streptomyces silvisoli]|uniref:YoaK family protein n=1 Tax=Streptomyces silvisoli TaxID=3034235 RepID=A0ABT5ZJT1_9ACTN|nr:YoaK family protein [Streptomyces silvisoli]MDF3289839.1 YoaK family protein [Streptomyces silvisoli]
MRTSLPGLKAPDDPMPAAVLSLTVTSGMLDAISFLSLGNVFVGMMTGNVMVVGFALGGAPHLSDPAPLLAVAGFVAGVATAGAAFRVAPGCRRWLFSALAGEISLLAVTTAVAFLAPDSRMGRNACVVLLSTTMGIRCAVIRRIGVPELRATFAFTGALVALVHDACAGTGAHASRRFGIIAAMTFGAAVGAATVIQLGLGWSLLATSLAVAAITFALRLHPHLNRNDSFFGLDGVGS